MPGIEVPGMRRVAVVLPTLGRSPFLRASLEALERQGGGRFALEIVVVAQGGCSVPEGGWRVLPLPRNQGFAAATNLGIAAARGGDGPEGEPEMIATVNDDVLVGAGWLERLVEALDADPRAAAVQGTNLLGLSPAQNGVEITDGCGLAWNRAWQAVQIGHGEPPPAGQGLPCEVFGVSATAALYRTAVLARAAAGLRRGEGPFDSRLGSYYEDVDLACRLRARGATALWVPAARARHAGSTTGGGMPVARWRWIYGNRWLVAARLLGSRFAAEAPRMAVRDLADLAAALTAGRGRQALGLLSGWGRALVRLPAWVHRGGPSVPESELERLRVGG